MKKLISIRKRLGLTQAQMARELDLSQANIAHYEIGRVVPPINVARKLKIFASSRGISLTYEDIYED